MIAAGLLFLTWPEPAFACSCVPFNQPPTPEVYRTWLKGFAGEVFRGTVVETSPVRGRGLQVTFRVERRWKGVPATEVVLYTPYGTTCDVRLEVGERRVVAAVRENGRLTFHQCLLMLMEENPTAFLNAIGEGSPPPTASPR